MRMSLHEPVSSSADPRQPEDQASKPSRKRGITGSQQYALSMAGREHVSSLTAAPAGLRALVAGILGVVSGLLVSLAMSWQAAALIGWDVAAMVLLSWIWLVVGPMDPAVAKAHAAREDSSVRLSELLVLTASVAFLAAVGMALLRAAGTHGGTKAFLIGISVLSVALAWALVHTMFTLRYARIYYSDLVGGIDFNDHEPPAYLDFAYLAFTIGMTFQVSDTNLTSKPIRRTALRHALLSYLFGAVLLGLAINVVASILG
jgi:uncharacterized membrane protein